MTTRGSGGTAHTCSGRHSQYSCELIARVIRMGKLIALHDLLSDLALPVTHLCLVPSLYRFLVLAGVSGWSVLAERNNLPEDLDTGTAHPHTISLTLSPSPLPCTLVYTIAYVCVAMALKTVSVSVLHHHCSHHISLSRPPSSLGSSSPTHSFLLLLTPAVSLRSSSLYPSLSVWMRQSSSLSCHVLCC